MLLLQEFDFRIQHRPGVQHAVADYLSHLESGETVESTYDDLPDAGLFNLTTVPDDNEDEWITEMTHFLSTSLPPCQIRVYNGRIHTVPLDNPRLGYFCK